MSDVETEAEERLTGKLVERVDIPVCLPHVGANAHVDFFRFPILPPHVFETTDDAAFL